MADASVRPARINDAPAVGIVQAEVFRRAYAGRVPADILEEFTPTAFAAAWRESLEHPPEGAYQLLVACAGAQVVGVAAVGPSQDPDAEPLWAEVTLLAVHPEGRRVGHGSRLLQAAVDHLTEVGAEELAVWTLADDETTRAFLLGAGFQPDSAYRDRVVSEAGEVLREVRLRAALAGR